jgi:tryptophan synthase beta chain
MPEPVKILLSESEIPTHWINLMPDLPGAPAPPLRPDTLEPAGPDDLSPIFPMGLIAQEVSADAEVEIPDEVRELYKLWRPTPLHRARRLEQELDTPAHLYYKYEGTSPAGSHKPNTAVPQAHFNKQEGIKRLSTETGAGQWGSALALACRLMDMECVVFMVGSSYDQKPYRRSMMEAWGATVHRSPSEQTQAGRAQAEHPTGSLGIAISEAVEVAAGDGDTNYALGSVLNHVLLHQTVIGQESPGPNGNRGRVSGCRDRLCRRRLELRRHRDPVRAREPARWQDYALRRLRAGCLPHPHARRLSL